MTKLFSKHTTIVLNEALAADLGDAMLGARSLMDVLAAAPRGLMSLLSMSTQDDDNDDNGP